MLSVYKRNACERMLQLVTNTYGDLCNIRGGELGNETLTVVAMIARDLWKCHDENFETRDHRSREIGQSLPPIPKGRGGGHLERKEC